VIAEVALSNIDPGAQQDVMQQARVPMPGQQTADRIWSIIVTGFIIVLIGAFLSLALVHTGTMNFLYNATISGDVLLTVFTTAAGFLAGLLSPSPLSGAHPATVKAPPCRKGRSTNDKGELVFPKATVKTLVELTPRRRLLSFYSGAIVKRGSRTRTKRHNKVIHQESILVRKLYKGIVRSKSSSAAA
jgi:hypothetical protein